MLYGMVLSTSVCIRTHTHEKVVLLNCNDEVGVLILVLVPTPRATSEIVHFGGKTN